MPALSIVVPLQEHRCFDQFLHAISRQRGIQRSDFEIVAVDSLYLEDWPSLVTSYRKQIPDLQITLRQIPRTRSRARQLNVGVDLARAPVLLLLADDFIPSAGLVADHLAAHRDSSSEQLVAIGPGLFSDENRGHGFMRWLEDSGELFGVSFTDPEFRLPPHYFYMANTSLKSSFLAGAGKFDESFPYDAMDDWEMGGRLCARGMQNLFLPNAVAIHEHFIDLPERCRAMRNAGESSAIYDKNYPRRGPWQHFLAQPATKASKRQRETPVQRYQRVLREHWLRGYRSVQFGA